jgi:hypothetical protein
MPSTIWTQPRYVNKKKVTAAWLNPSKSNPKKTHETLLYEDGSTSCNCSGWTRRCAPNGSRSCTHTQAIQNGTAGSPDVKYEDTPTKKPTLPVKLLKAKVRNVNQGMRISDNGHTDEPNHTMEGMSGKVIEVEPAEWDHWYEDTRWYWHESWLDFDYDKPKPRVQPAPVASKSLFTQDVKVLSISVG